MQREPVFQIITLILRTIARLDGTPLAKIRCRAERDRVRVDSVLAPYRSSDGPIEFRRIFFWTFPIALRGSASTNTTRFGVL